MMKNWTYRTKNRALVAGVVLMLVLSYSLAINKTVEEWSVNKEGHAKIKAAKMAPQEIKDLEDRLVYLNESMGGFVLDSGHTHEDVLKVITVFCAENRVRLLDFPQPEVSLQKDFAIYHSKVVAQGTFQSLIKLVYMLEQENRLSRVANVGFSKERDKVTKRWFLSVTIYLENIKFLSDEKLG